MQHLLNYIQLLKHKNKFLKKLRSLLHRKKKSNIFKETYFSFIFIVLMYEANKNYHMNLKIDIK